MRTVFSASLGAAYMACAIMAYNSDPAVSGCQAPSRGTPIFRAAVWPIAVFIHGASVTFFDTALYHDCSIARRTLLHTIRENDVARIHP